MVIRYRLLVVRLGECLTAEGAEDAEFKREEEIEGRKVAGVGPTQILASRVALIWKATGAIALPTERRREAGACPRFRRRQAERLPDNIFFSALCASAGYSSATLGDGRARARREDSASIGGALMDRIGAIRKWTASSKAESWRSSARCLRSIYGRTDEDDFSASRRRVRGIVM